MLQQMLNILEQMDLRDANVQALKTLVTSQMLNKKIYHLQYKNGNPVMVNVVSNLDAEYCNDTTVSLNDHGECIWYTDSLLIAAYNKYVSTPWFNSDMEQCEHSYNPEDVNIVDNDGKVYNTKPLTNKTIAMIKDYMQPCNRVKNADEEWLNSYANLTNYYVIEECKNFNPTKPKNIDDAYMIRKQLVDKKGKALKAGKSIKSIQKKLDTINKVIKSYGGK